MFLIKWESLPPEMQMDAIRPFYDYISKRKLSLFFKRIFDIIFSSILLFFLFPIFGFISIFILLDSKGPVFFRQVRVTQYGKRFKIFKFRTMVSNAENIGASVTSQNDARITRVGSRIRHCRLDELCQLIDVFRGTMSFVGTRPEVPKYIQQYTPEMMATLLLPAGVTCLATILHKEEERLLQDANDAERMYTETLLPQKMKCNLEELMRFGFWHDIKILFMTIFAMMGKRYPSYLEYSQIQRKDPAHFNISE